MQENRISWLIQVLPPFSKLKLPVFLANVEWRNGDTFNSSGWKDGYAPVKEDKSLQGLLCMKIEVNGESKYYTFRTPHIEYPDQLAVHYRQINSLLFLISVNSLPIFLCFLCDSSF